MTRKTAPSPRAAIGEEFGIAPGTPVTWELNTALRRCGFDRVFDTNFAADLTIIEEGTELIERLDANLVKGHTSRPLPQLTSCSPGWVKYAEHFYPEFLPHVSSCKSLQQMIGALLKTWYAKRIAMGSGVARPSSPASRGRARLDPRAAGARRRTAPTTPQAPRRARRHPDPGGRGLSAAQDLLRLRYSPVALQDLVSGALADFARTHHDRLGDTGIAAVTTLVRRHL
ncbi:MAG: hypothetical protein JW751_00375, partial [Polyangiaceae bacterium]|nr:hypothetical protein [Polyangiaceae bacterium]